MSKGAGIREVPLRITISISVADPEAKSETTVVRTAESSEWYQWGIHIVSAIEGTGYSKAGVIGGILEVLASEADDGDLSDLDELESITDDLRECLKAFEKAGV